MGGTVVRRAPQHVGSDACYFGLFYLSHQTFDCSSCASLKEDDMFGLTRRCRAVSFFPGYAENVLGFFWLQVYKRTAAGYFVLEIKVEFNHKFLTYSCKPFLFSVLIWKFFSKQYETNILQKINN